MFVSERLVGAAALIGLFHGARGQGPKSLLAPKGAEVLTVGVIGGTSNRQSGAVSASAC